MEKQLQIRQFLNAHSWADETKDKYGRVVGLILEDLGDLSELSAVEFRDWLDGSTAWGDSMRHVAANGIKNFLRWTYGANHPALSLSVKRPKSAPQRTLRDTQVYDLLVSFDTFRPKGRRDLAMCCLFLDSGLRVSEVARLEMMYLNLLEGRLDVIVKGGSWGSAVFSQYTAALLYTWLADRKRIVQPGVSAVFVGTHSKPGNQMTRDGIKSIVAQWGKIADIGKISPHDFRRTFATLATRRGAPRKTLMVAGRWKSAEMIDLYTRDIEQSDFSPYFPVPGVLCD